MIRLYTLIHSPNEPSKRGECLIESEHMEAISAVIKALNLVDYVVDKDILTTDDGKGLIASTFRYQTTFSDFSE